MSLPKHVKESLEKSGYWNRETDRIIGTTKIRTYCANCSVYSKESSLEKLPSGVHYGRSKKQG